MSDKSKTGAVLIVGGGIAGAHAALLAADNDLLVYLVERDSRIGGMTALLDRTYPTPKCGLSVGCNAAERGAGGWDRESTAIQTTYSSDNWSKCLYCCTTPRLDECHRHRNIEVLTGTTVADVQGDAGDFTVKVDQAGRVTELTVGAIILASGFGLFDAASAGLYGYGKVKNVVTSLEFEQSMNLFGSGHGQALRPSDGSPPAKIAWLQCVGSRDINHGDNPWCSSVCCMSAVKEASMVKESAARIETEVDAAIFYMDMRTFDKGYERYYARAKDQLGVRFVRGRVSGVKGADGDDVKVSYAEDDGTTFDETFQMVVLSVGLTPDPDLKALAGKLGVSLGDYGFVAIDPQSSVKTSRDGIYVCGAAGEPKDIPSSVTEALAAAENAVADLTLARGSLSKPELPIIEGPGPDDEVRIGVFWEDPVEPLDTNSLAEYASGLPGVVLAEKIEAGSVTADWERLKAAVKDSNLNRVVVAGGTPLAVEAALRDAARLAGVSPQLTAVANIREQAALVAGDDTDGALEKAKDLIRMAVAKVTLVNPIPEVRVPVTSSALVIGGGAGGLTAALELAKAGYPVTVVEKSGRLGGNALSLRRTWRGREIEPVINDLIAAAEAEDLITVYTKAEVKRSVGYAGHFATTFIVEGNPRTVEHGVVIVATGGRELTPTEYMYGRDDRVLTSLEMDRLLMSDPDQAAKAERAVFIQCVGSREPERMYCSKVCCTHAVSSALALKELNSEMEVFVLHRDVRTYGFREELYLRAREAGVVFVRFGLDSKPEVSADGEALKVEVTDVVAGAELAMSADLLVLSAAILPSEAAEVAMAYNVGLGADGFFQETHAKLEPVDLMTPGVFVAGLAHYPKSFDESMIQARAAAGRALAILGRENYIVDGVFAGVDIEKCGVCCTCVRTCPLGIPYIGPDGGAVIDAARCYGCGMCVSECPGKAIDLSYFSDGLILAETGALV